MKKLFLLFIFPAFLFLTVTKLCAQTYVNTAITSNTTWTVANNPYIVTGNIAVFPNVTLTIDPGVTVEFDDNIVFTVKGMLKAIGAANDSIVFTSSSSSPHTSIWKGINLENNQGATAEFDYCKGLYADAFITMLASSPADTTLTMHHSRFSFNYIAVFNYASTSSYVVIIDSCQFSDNLLAIIYADHLTISNCVFSNNTKGIYGYDSQQHVQVSNSIFTGQTDYNILLKGTVTGCSFMHNVYGINLRYGLTATDNIITDNTYGISSFTGTNITGNPISHNTICNNTYNVYMQDNFNIDLSNNCWCTLDSAAIEETIFDAHDNGILGIVTYMPVDASCKPLETSVSSYASSDLFVKSYPNPFISYTTIQFSLPEASSISLNVFDAKGRLIKTLLNNEIYGSGDHSVNFYREHLPAGVYYYKLGNETQVITGKMILMK